MQLGCLGMGRSVPRGLPTSKTHSDGGVPGQDSPWAESLQVALTGLARMVWACAPLMEDWGFGVRTILRGIP